MKVDVAIVGGGLSGLFTAFDLRAAGIGDVVVLEASDQPGGVARTRFRDGYSLEPGAGSFTLPHPHLSPVLAHLGADVRAADEAASVRYVWTGGRLVTLPASPAALTAPLASWRGKARAALEPLVPAQPGDDNESLDRVLRRRFGDDLGGTLAWLAASGVYAGDPTRLSSTAAFPMLSELEARHGSIVKGVAARLRSRPPGTPRPSSHLPVGGMATLCDAAAVKLGDRFRRSHRVDAVHRSDRRWVLEGAERIEAEHVVLTCSPDTARGLIQDDALRQALAGSVAAPVVVVGLGGPAERFPLPPGFGILTGHDAGMWTRGVLLESSYAPERAPMGHSLVKVIAGGAVRSGVVEADDDLIVETIGSEVTRILGTDIDASFVEIVRHRRGIPQYELGHRTWLEAVDAATPPKLHLTGWSYRGVGLSNLAIDATRLAHLIAKH